MVAALRERIAGDPAFADRALEAYTRVWELKAALGLVADEDPAEFALCR